MGHQRDYSEDVARIVDEEVRRLIEAAHDEAWEILTQYRHVLDDLVLKLLEKETLNEAELAAIFTPVHQAAAAARVALLRGAPGQRRSRRCSPPPSGRAGSTCSRRTSPRRRARPPLDGVGQVPEGGRVGGAAEGL